MTSTKISTKIEGLAQFVNNHINSKAATASLLFPIKGNAKMLQIDLKDIVEYLRDLVRYQRDLSNNKDSFFQLNRSMLCQQLVSIEDLMALAGIEHTVQSYCKFENCKPKEGDSVSVVVKFICKNLPVEHMDDQYKLFLELVEAKMIHLYNAALYTLTRYAHFDKSLKAFTYHPLPVFRVASVSANSVQRRPQQTIENIIAMNDSLRSGKTDDFSSVTNGPLPKNDPSYMDTENLSVVTQESKPVEMEKPKKQLPIDDIVRDKVPNQPEPIKTIVPVEINGVNMTLDTRSSGSADESYEIVMDL
jgi:hypothetical protein